MRIARGPSLEIYNAPAFQSSKDGCICRLIEAGTLIGYRCACHPTREGKGQALASQLSDSEKAVCARIGINESEYLEQKSAAGPMTVQINPALRDDRRAGHRAAKGRFASGIDGRAIIEEARSNTATLSTTTA